MDPLSALSVAAAAVQLFDFGSRVLSKSWQIYNSNKSQDPNQVELSFLTSNLTSLADKVQALCNNIPERTGGSAAGILRGLCNDSIALKSEAESLITKLNRCGVSKYDLTDNVFLISRDRIQEQADGKPGQASAASKFQQAKDSVVNAIKEVLSSKRIESLRQRISQNRELLTSATLVCLWEESQEQGKVLRELLGSQKSRDEGGENSDPDAFRREIQSLALFEAGTAAARRAMAHKMWHAGWEPQHPSRQFEAEERHVSNSGAGTDDIAVAMAIQQNLHFQGMDHRGEAIPKAYTATFDWLYMDVTNPAGDEHQRWSSFPRWLETASKDIYWVTGKPGSGKSTLMKYITSNPTTQRHLEVWSEDMPLITASFYFWQAGTDMQKSQGGLVRTLLSQCIRQLPMLSRQICPRRWAFYDIFGSDASLPSWSWRELAEGFKALVSSAHHHRIAIFIDGLDEFEGDPAVLIEFINGIAINNGVKVCISSRPWNMFSDAYRRKPSLRMEQLTQDDIALFVDEQLKLNPGFKELSEIFPSEAQQLVMTVVTKASGVFLWVSLVVASLLRGLTEGDKLSDLQNVINGLPDDIQDLFQRIWESIDDRYKDQAVEFVLLHKTAKHPFHAATLWLADEKDSLAIDVARLDIENIIAATKRRLNSRTKGLLEVSAHGNIEYIHRTAYDWMNGIWEDVSSRVPETFDVHLELAKAETCALLIGNKLLDCDDPESTGLPLMGSRWCWRHIMYCFWHAMNAKSNPISTTRLIPILDRLDSSIQTILDLSRKADGPDQEISNPDISKYTTCGGLTWKADLCSHRHEIGFLGMAAKFALVPYLKAKITSKEMLPDLEIGTYSLLEAGVFGLECLSLPPEIAAAVKTCHGYSNERRLQVVGLLVKMGANAGKRCHTGKGLLDQIKAVHSIHDAYVDAVLVQLKKPGFFTISGRLGRKERRRGG